MQEKFLFTFWMKKNERTLFGQELILLNSYSQARTILKTI